MGGDLPPTWNHSPDGLAVKAGDAEESLFSGVDPLLIAEAVKRLNWQGMRAFTEKLGAAPADVPLLGEGAHTLRVPSWYSPHLSHADEVAGVLAEAVARAATGD